MSTDTLVELVVIAAAVSALSMTIAGTKACRPLRLAAGCYRPLNELLRCPYCLAHWLAGAILAMLRPSWALPIELFAVVGISSLFSLAIAVLLERVDR